jgi:nitrile hydratase accessory protein
MKLNSDLPSLPELPGGSSEPIFNEPWEASTFAIAVCLNHAGLFSWTEWVEVFSKEIKDAEAANPNRSGQYYHTWFAALEKLVVDRHVLDKQAIDSKQKYLRDNPPPHDHHAHRAPIAIG